MGEYKYPFREVIISNTPTENFVRCKDCKYYGYEGMKYCTRVMDEYNIGFLMDADDFCSRGERKKPTEF